MSGRRLLFVPCAIALCVSALAVTRSAALAQISNTASSAGNFLITDKGMAGLTLGMSLEQARRTLRGVLFERTSDGDGAALVTVTLPGGHHVVVFANEENPDTSIDWTRRILSIETFEPAFATADGIRVGMPIADVTSRLGAVREIVRSEIESREYITFQRQPAGLRFRLDYSGEFGMGNRTTTYRAGAMIFSIAVQAVESSG
jgi:hypothetical protein